MRWRRLGELANAEKVGLVLKQSRGQKGRGTFKRALAFASEVKGTGGETAPELLSASDVFGLVRSASADRELYKEVVRATERGGEPRTRADGCGTVR